MRIPKSFETANAVNEWSSQIKLPGDLEQFAQRNVKLDNSLVLMINFPAFELPERQLVKLVNDEEVNVDDVVTLGNCGG